MLCHFFIKLVVKGKTSPENFHFHLSETAKRVDTSRKLISEIPRHFGEQFQTDLVEKPLVLGGHGTRVLMKELKVCLFNIHEMLEEL